MKDFKGKLGKAGFASNLALYLQWLSSKHSGCQGVCLELGRVCMGLAEAAEKAWGPAEAAKDATKAKPVPGKARNRREDQDLVRAAARGDGGRCGAA